MTTKQQKDEERRCLDSFFEALLVKPDSVDDRDPNNPPDFFVEIDGKRIAIELTEYHQTASLNPRSRVVYEQEWVKLRNLIDNCRKSKYPQLNNISVLLYSKNLQLPVKRQKNQFIKELIEFVGSNANANGLPIYDFKHQPLLSQYLKRIDIDKINCNWMISWDWNHMAGSVGTNEHELKQIIMQSLLHRLLQI